MQRYFGPEGLLSRNVPDFEYRGSQQEMAEAVFEALSAETPLMAEAGTGTGKTWAYLIPAILSGKKVIVSTGTKTLQDQILDHDVPFLRDRFFPKLQAVCVKGRGNYLCRRRFREFSYQPTLYSRSEALLFRRFQKWGVRTDTGDRAEIAWLPDQFQTWNEVCSRTEYCLGQQCEDNGRCFLTRLRMEASRANLLIVNHHLFFADLSLRRKGLGEVLPDYDAVIFDEAHQLEDTMSLYFGVHFSTLRLADLARDLKRECGRDPHKAKNFQPILNIAQQLEQLGRFLHHYFVKLNGNPGRFPLDGDSVGSGFVDAFDRIIHALEQLNGHLAPLCEKNPSFEVVHRGSLELCQAAQEILDRKDPALVYWFELTQQAVFFSGTPVDVAFVFRERLLAKTPAVVLVSATLSVAGSFDFLRQSVGMPPESREMILASPFSYERQALLYVPSRFPAPQEPDFVARVAEEALEILKKTRGRALFLFTSYKNMHEVYQRLKDSLPYPLFIQGQKPKRALLADFREQIDSVLLATSSFWQGIDVPGESLSCLLIDKLPFEVPDDPLIAARMARLTERGKSAFFHYQVPRAVIQLKQGAGRLIRSSRDRGIIAIFDVRLLTKNYGRLFLRSLPPCRMVHEPGKMDEFLATWESFPGNSPDEASAS